MLLQLLFKRLTLNVWIMSPLILLQLLVQIAVFRESPSSSF